MAIVKVTRQTENSFKIQNKSGSRIQMAWGLRLDGRGYSLTRSGKPAYYHATWETFRWVLGEEATQDDWDAKA